MTVPVTGITHICRLDHPDSEYNKYVDPGRYGRVYIIEKRKIKLFSPITQDKCLLQRTNAVLGNTMKVGSV